MLIRVSNNISKFPAHIVPILTSTVVECFRAGLKVEAFEYASMLMRPEYRPKMDPKFKRKIEQIVRRPEKDVVEESKSACPFCECSVKDTELICPECKSDLPYCIATGQHMVLSDWTDCPNCEFPALASKFRLIIESTGACPMCSQQVSPSDIFLKSKTTLIVGKPQEKLIENESLQAESFGGLAI
jgi:WD repeat-containing protein 19